MKLVNRDLTKESVHLYVSNHQIYARIWSKTSQKWETETYCQSYDFLIDEELVATTIKYIVRTWNLKNPRITVE